MKTPKEKGMMYGISVEEKIDIALQEQAKKIFEDIMKSKANCIEDFIMFDLPLIKKKYLRQNK